MSNITNVERVAVALFSWKKREPLEGWIGRWYEHDDGLIVVVAENGEASKGTGEYWPDFTDEIRAPYWCDRMQRELAKRGLLGKYAMHLDALTVTPPDGDLLLTWRESVCLLSFPAQRLEAAVRVIEEEGL